MDNKGLRTRLPVGSHLGIFAVASLAVSRNQVAALSSSITHPVPLRHSNPHDSDITAPL